VNPLAFHPSGRYVAVQSGRGSAICGLEIQQIPDGKVVRTWQIPPMGNLEFAPDGRHLFVHSTDSCVYVLRLAGLD